MTREEHIAWCKKRALEYLNAGDPPNAFTSFCSDMRKHPETFIEPEAVQAGLLLITQGNAAELRRWIEGFR